MADTVFIKDLKDHVGKTATIQGWMFNKRGGKGIHFLQLRDGSGVVQGVVFDKSEETEVFKTADKLTMESSVKVTGEVTQHPKHDDVFELQVSEIEIVHLVDGEYPIAKKEHGTDFLLENRHLWLRSKRQRAIQIVRNTIINGIYEYLNKEGFIKIDSPILTPNACEGTTTLFDVEYFDEGKAYLSQSGQLYLEAAIFSVGRCFDFGPVFRAEKSKTRRHLTEFWMMDAEAAFVEHEENMKIQEGLIVHVIKKALEENKKELADLERDVSALEKIEAPFIYKTHAEVVKELQEMGSDIKENDDLGGDDETILTNKYDKPIFVEKYPAEVKAFYMKRDPENENLALCADMLAPEGYGEVIGGSEREADYDVLLGRIKEHGLDEKEFSWYLDLRKYGSVPHSGFGIGLERLTGWICGTKHIRETIPFPRLINRIRP
ncbi:asparagine--tRNA ligase [Candidatus Peregrinibacteria bacterium]|jgi:asparaginyl-tRNA synthetase|nr:asparagine--tRNA ligase [Candidatus Peregrinibacteria bacterium]MBT7736104.1 asparagine--tRNA ligase [Candidatus Peregrinibacteria bacterium]